MTKIGQNDSPSKEEAPTPTTKKQFLTPGRFVTILCVVNLINYVDRGVIASNGVNGSSRTCNNKGVCSAGTEIQGEFNLTNFQDGLLSYAFMVGLLVASPIFDGLSKKLLTESIIYVIVFRVILKKSLLLIGCRINLFKLINVGLSVWTIAAAGCGFSYNFWMIAVFRMFVGVGEASFISLAAPYIDDSAPVARDCSTCVYQLELL